VHQKAKPAGAAGLRVFAGSGQEWYPTGKLPGNSGIYWHILLNQIDFRPEFVHYWRPVGGTRTTRANYLILIDFFRKRF
jgi:hypothetical protein